LFGPLLVLIGRLPLGVEEARPTGFGAATKRRSGYLGCVAALTVRTEMLRASVVVRLAGEIDAQNAHELEKALAAARGKGGRAVLVDMTGVTFVGSAGWGVFLGCARGVESEGKQLVLAGLSAELRKVLEMLYLHTVLALAHDVETAAHLIGG